MNANLEGTETGLSPSQESLLLGEHNVSAFDPPKTTQRTVPVQEGKTAGPPHVQESGDKVEASMPKQAIKRLLKGKEKEWSAVAEKKGPLRLLDLPVDVLRDIINQVRPTERTQPPK